MAAPAFTSVISRANWRKRCRWKCAASAINAWSAETRLDIERFFDVDPARVQVIHNGIDLDEYRPVESTTALERCGIDPRRPYLLFVGRITRQKGIIHLVRAIQFIDKDF